MKNQHQQPKPQVVQSFVVLIAALLALVPLSWGAEAAVKTDSDGGKNEILAGVKGVGPPCDELLPEDLEDLPEELEDWIDLLCPELPPDADDDDDDDDDD